MNLVPLFEEALEFQDYNGTVLSDGKVAVYYIGRTRLADIYEDVAAEYPAENPRILNNLGMGPVYVNPAFDYEMVVFDAYGSELFSVKKYLASKGEHSTANVVVTPSESIAVSAWTVGDVQVYMPYLTGQLGKVYTGIEPIVVNNVEDKISANHVPLGVQDPLYFVQDDEEGCIIGLSGGIVPEGTMNESAFGYQDGQITSYNGSAFSAGNSYEAGSYVDIDGNTINVTGLQPAGDYQSAGDYVSASELENLQPKGDYYSASNPSGFITGVDLTDYAKTEDLTAYQEKGNYYSASNPDGFINSDAISSMATTGFVAGVSADITAMIPTALTGDYLTKESADTLYQPIGNYQEALTFNYTNDDEISGINGSAIYGQGGVTGDFTLVEGNGIQLTDDPIAQTTTISVSGDYATNTQLQTVSGEITALIPSTAGLATEDWVTAQGYLTGVDLTPYQTTAGMTAYQPAGDYLTTADSANFYTTANESGYITAVPAGTMNESAFDYSGGMITAYNGSAFKAGDEFPQSATEAIETVTANSADWNGTTETVSSNSGVWGGSALPVSAGKGVKISLQNDTLVFENDETVLYSGARTSAAQLSENLYNFEMLRVNDIYGNIYNIGTNSSASQQLKLTNYGGQPQQLYVRFVLASSYLNIEKGFQLVNAIDGWNTPSTEWTTSNVNNTYSCEIISKVVGINRIAGE